VRSRGWRQVSAPKGRERTGSTVNTLVMYVLADTSMLAAAWVLTLRHLARTAAGLASGAGAR
jgi:hypothetical protein